MPTLEELLAASELTDNIELILPGDKKITVGQLREFARLQTAQRESAAAAQRDYEAKARATEEAKRKAEQLAADSLALWEEANKVKGSHSAAPDPRSGDIDWENDPVYRPVHQRLSKDLAPLTELQAEIKKLQAAMAAGFKFVTDDFQERRWNEIPKDQRPKDKTWRDFLEEAEKQNLKDVNGLYDPRAAWERATAEERRAAELKAAEERGAKRKEEELRGMPPRPGSIPRIPESAKAPKFKDLNDAIAQAANDPEILRIANGEVQ